MLEIFSGQGNVITEEYAYLTALNHKEKAIATISVQKQREQKLAAFVKVQVLLHITERTFALLGGS